MGFSSKPYISPECESETVQDEDISISPPRPKRSMGLYQLAMNTHSKDVECSRNPYILNSKSMFVCVLSVSVCTTIHYVLNKKSF